LGIPRSTFQRLHQARRDGTTLSAAREGQR
jgi:hypothetical protein